MEDNWGAIVLCILVIGFFGSLAFSDLTSSQVKIEQEKTHQLQIQLDLEKSQTK